MNCFDILLFLSFIFFFVLVKKSTGFWCSVTALLVLFVLLKQLHVVLNKQQQFLCQMITFVTFVSNLVAYGLITAVVAEMCLVIYINDKVPQVCLR